MRVRRLANLLTLLFGMVAATAVAQISNVEQLGHEAYDSASDIWGYTHPNGVDYAIMGIYDATVIIDTSTDPSNPQQVASIAGPSSIWRDIKTHGRYAYVVTEGGGPGAGMQIIDLRSPTRAQLVGTYNATLNTAHNLYIDEGFAYVAGTNTHFGGFAILDLSNPTAPVEVGAWEEAYVHDVYVRNDTAYAACLGDGLFIIEVSDKSNPTTIASFNYPGSATHNAWLNDDGDYLLLSDEREGGHLTIWDIRDLTNIERVASYQSDFTGSIHNAMVLGDYVYISYYRDWLRIVDISDPTHPVEAGVYDLNPTNNTGTYSNAWGVYPFTRSGQIYISHIEQGLYVLNHTTGPQPDISLGAVTVDDDAAGGSQGNGDSIVQAGETIVLSIELENSGDRTAGAVGATLRCDESTIAVSDSSAGPVSVFTSDPADLAGAFKFSVDSQVARDRIVNFQVHVTDALLNEWTLAFDLNVQGDPATGVGEMDRGALVPEAAVLLESYPNPVSPRSGGATSIVVRIGREAAGQIGLRVVNLRGQTVRRLIRSGVLTEGVHHLAWDGRDSVGALVPAGTYFLVLDSRAGRRVSKLAVVR